MSYCVVRTKKVKDGLDLLEQVRRSSLKKDQHHRLRTSLRRSVLLEGEDGWTEEEREEEGLGLSERGGVDG